MSDEPPPTPTVPPLRFGLRAMLVSTAIAALFAPVAAPLSWGASEAVQRLMLIAWCAMLCSIAATFGFLAIRTRRSPRKAGQVRFYARAAWARKRSPAGPPLLCWGSVFASPGVMYLWFSTIAGRGNTPDPAFPWTIWIGMFIGYMLGLTFRQMIPWPVALADEGIVEYGKLLRWQRFSRAERLADRPGIIKLHRIHYDFLGQDDLCIQLEPEIESAALAFLSEKIAASRGGAK